MINKNQVKNAKLILSNCLALTIRKQGTVHNYTGEFWMYENGYLLFQGFLSANAVCWWNESLSEAQKHLQYYGFVAPGILLVSADSYSLEVIRNAWSKSMLKPPSGYQITELGEIDNCILSPCTQGQFTPLPEAICEAVFQITSRGQPAVPELIKFTLSELFAHIQQPSERLIYDCLVQLATERKLYQTSRGYFIVTPEQRRSRSHLRRQRRSSTAAVRNGLLMSNEEAMVFVHGDITTIRDGLRTHQSIQTNLSDVISGGNEFDKVIYARNSTAAAAAAAAFPIKPVDTPFTTETQQHFDRGHSFRLFSNHSKKLKRSVSTCTISKRLASRTSTIGDFSTLSSPMTATTTTTTTTTDLPIDKKRLSFFSKWFRKSSSSSSSSKRSTLTNSSLNGQFPPIEWFNSKILHLHNVATQTNNLDIEYSSSLYRRRTREKLMNHRSAETLPRRSTRNSQRKPSSLLVLPPELVPSVASASVATTTTTATVSNTRNNTLPKTILTTETKPKKMPSSSDPTTTTTTSGPSSLDSTTGSASKKPPALAPQKNNSFILQVKTNQKQNSRDGCCDSSNGNDTNRLTVTKSMTTINSGKNTKIYVENSPIRSVITFENHDNDNSRNSSSSSSTNEPKVVVINEQKSNENHKLHKNKVNEKLNNNSEDGGVKRTDNIDLNVLKKYNHRFDVINNCWPMVNNDDDGNSRKYSNLTQQPSAASKFRSGINSVETLVDSVSGGC